MLKLTGFKLALLNISGALYTSLTITTIALINLYCTCPDLNEDGDCFWASVWAALILAEIFLNLMLFHYYNKRNRVQYWTAKSSSLLDGCSFEQKAGTALNGQFIGSKNGGGQKAVESISRKWTIPNVHQQYNKNENIQTRHDIRSFTKYAICEDGTYRGTDDFCEKLNDTFHDMNAYNERNSPCKYCSQCKQVVPQRSHHCPLCGICVLRKDHHCLMLGGCAGLANQRYFIVFLFWASIGAAYGTSFNFAYLDKHVVHWFPFGWLYYLGPVAMARWAFGLESAFNMGLSVLFSMSAVSTLGALGFFFFQMLYTLSGYTMYDYHRAGPRRAESDGETFAERLALVFGRRWWLNFLFPQFWVPNQMNQAIARNIFLSVSKDL